MQKYVNQLIEDIKAITANPEQAPEPQEGEVIQPQIERWIHGGSLSTMGQLFGLEKVQFPPEDKLTTTQKEELVDAMMILWRAYHFNAVFPGKLPKALRYTHIVDCLDRDVPFIGEGRFSLEFCYYEPENCPFDLEYCSCKDFDFYKNP